MPNLIGSISLAQIFAVVIIGGVALTVIIGGFMLAMLIAGRRK